MERLEECGIQHNNMAIVTQQRVRYCLGTPVLEGFRIVRPCPLKNRHTKRYQFKPAHLALTWFQERLTRSGWSLDLLKNEPD